MEFKSFFLFAFFSSFEYVAIFILSFTLFRFYDFLYNSASIARIIFVSLALSYISYTMRVTYEMGGLSVAVQMVVYIAFVWLLFRVQVFYAAIMAVTGVMIYSALQFSLTALLEIIGFIADKDIMQQYGPIIQICTAVITVVLCRAAQKRNIGFSFISDSPYSKVDLNRDNVVFIVFLAIAVIVHALAVYLYLEAIVTKISYLALAMVITSAPLVYFAIKKDRYE
jgi:hypothetical protein